jgi:hypothetical protein
VILRRPVPYTRSGGIDLMVERKPGLGRPSQPDQSQKNVAIVLARWSASSPLVGLRSTRWPASLAADRRPPCSLTTADSCRETRQVRMSARLRADGLSWRHLSMPDVRRWDAGLFGAALDSGGGRGIPEHGTGSFDSIHRTL